MPKNWKDIHPDFTPELVQEWQNRAFTYNQTYEWVQAGLEPTDYRFAIYLRDVVKCEPEEILNQGDLPELKNQFQEYLKENQEEFELIESIALSLDIKNSKQELSNKELESYLQEKRLDLKKYFVFNIQELTTEKLQVDGSLVHNGRGLTTPLAEDLTQLALAHGWDNRELNDEGEPTDERINKNILILTKENGSPPSKWESQDLDKKITNGENLYIIFPKSEKWVNWKGKIGNALESTIVIARVKLSLYLKSKGEALRILRKNDPTIFTEETSESENEVLEQMGVDSSEYEAPELERMLEYVNIASQNKDKLPTGEGEIKKLIFFSPPHFQDKDCAVVVSEKEMTKEEINLLMLMANGSGNSTSEPNFSFHWKLKMIEDCLPSVWLLVYEAPWESIGNNLYAKQIKSCSSLERAEKEANRLVEKLMDKNNPYPACAVFEKVGDVFKAFSIIGDVEGVKGFGLTSFSSVKNNPDGCFKPLDIARIETYKKLGIKIRYSHVGVYLGKDKDGKHKVAQVTKENNDAGITEWKELFDENAYGISRYHVFVPYKKTELIKEHIARAVASNEYVGAYSLAGWTPGRLILNHKGNCQHFVNNCLLGLDVSNEITIFKMPRLLSNEISKSNKEFDKLTISNANKEFHKEKIEEVDRCVIVHEPYWKWNKLVELRPSSNCKLQ